MPNYSPRMRLEIQTSSQLSLMLLSQEPRDPEISHYLFSFPVHGAIKKRTFWACLWILLYLQAWEWVEAGLKNCFRSTSGTFLGKNNMHKQTWWFWGSSLPSCHHLQMALCSKQRERVLDGAFVLTLLLFFISTPIFSRHTLGSLCFLPQEIVYHVIKKNKGILEM